VVDLHARVDRKSSWKLRKMSDNPQELKNIRLIRQIAKEEAYNVLDEHLTRCKHEKKQAEAIED